MPSATPLNNDASIVFGFARFYALRKIKKTEPAISKKSAATEYPRILERLRYFPGLRLPADTETTVVSAAAGFPGVGLELPSTGAMNR